MKNKLKQNHGFTLIEMIVAVAITGIIGAAVGVMIVAAMRANNAAVLLATARSNTAFALSIIKDNLMYASAAELRTDEAVASGKCLYVEDGSIVVYDFEAAAGEEVAQLFGRDAMEDVGTEGDLFFDLAFSTDGGSLLAVLVRVQDETGSKTYFEASTTFQLVNVDAITLTGTASDLDGDGEADDYDFLGFE